MLEKYAEIWFCIDCSRKQAPICLLWIVKGWFGVFFNPDQNWIDKTGIKYVKNRWKSLYILLSLLHDIHTCNVHCFLFQITSWPAVPTLKGSGMPSLTAYAVHLGSRGVLPTPCFTWCGSALYFFVNVIRYDPHMLTFFFLFFFFFMYSDSVTVS